MKGGISAQLMWEIQLCLTIENKENKCLSCVSCPFVFFPRLSGGVLSRRGIFNGGDHDAGCVLCELEGVNLG